MPRHEASRTTAMAVNKFPLNRWLFQKNSSPVHYLGTVLTDIPVHAKAEDVYVCSIKESGFEVWYEYRRNYGKGYWHSMTKEEKANIPSVYLIQLLLVK